ncbi:DUF2232 domain-containing protein [Oculatella sp. FACHB-28]|uniref:DUF2232 domain-containing protein n=1 Tax=Oculatella sp. FACHB-28 TaxID=2692845 RepID=UPI001681CE71|nr:DUF2232 domain-containing protein [Oculatella sp. FACHB-28]MBD1868606.1 DUF2232 domain-containing protein [Cyanobacteria bacterium FACHB-471]MBD2060149.1 DUF2232 domain-containing protein [Oculatella sp. FACHB-28]
MSGSFEGDRSDPIRKQGSSPESSSDPKSDPAFESDKSAQAKAEENFLDDPFAVVADSAKDQQTGQPELVVPEVKAALPPLAMVETAFLASTASLLWLVSYYLSIGAWMRILFPAPIALVYLRWGHRAAWMSALVTGLLLSVLMGPYLSLLFFVPYGLLGVQLGALWKRQAGWTMSIGTGTLISTFGFFFRIWLLSTFLGEDLWIYLTNRITDFTEWILTKLVDWGLLGISALGQPDLTVIQLVTIGAIICSDLVYLFTVHLAAWLLLERLGNPIPEPPSWVQVLLEEEG